MHTAKYQMIYRITIYIIRSWRGKLYRYCGSLGQFRRGKYSRSSISDEEDIHEKSLAWLRWKLHRKSGTRLLAKIFQLQNMADFKFEKSKKLISKKGHRSLFMPKYHCELNPTGVKPNFTHTILTYIVIIVLDTYKGQ